MCRINYMYFNMLPAGMFFCVQEELGIPQLIDPTDLVKNPDQLAVMTYVSYFRHKVRVIDALCFFLHADRQRTHT